jgi:hypothetical protein
MRRKNTRVATSSVAAAANVAVEPMDEDEQQALVNKLDQESNLQQAQLDRAFGYLCITAAITCILCTAYVHRTTTSKSNSRDNDNDSSSNNTHLTLFRWMHGILASLLHIVSIRIVLVRTRSLSVWTYFPVALNLLLASVALFSARSLKSSQEDLLLTTADDDVKQTAIFFHYGLVISNVLVLCAAMLLRWDAQSTKMAIQELKDARYRHKSL